MRFYPFSVAFQAPKTPAIPLGVFAVVMVAIVTILGSSPAQADGYDDFSQASDAACKKIKLCLSQDETVPAEMKPMILMQAEGICAQMRLPKEYAQSKGFGPDHEVITSSTACLKAMAAEPCDGMQQDLPACEKANQIAEKYSQ